MLLFQIISRIPDCYIENNENQHPFEATADAIYRFNMDVIDAIADHVPAVKPQMAFYDQYGSWGFAVFEKTVRYAKQRNLIVVEDAKKNDIGNTVLAYAQGHLGEVQTCSGDLVPSLDVDFLTVSPFLGSDSLDPFIDICIKYNKGVFILARTSNPGSGDLQNARVENGDSVSVVISKKIAEYAERFHGQTGYSSIGAVVGATYPQEAAILRNLMPRSILLVPGYGAQGAAADDIAPNFNPDGFGAIVNSSRNILYAYEKSSTKSTCSSDEYIQSVINATKAMQTEIYGMLKERCDQLQY